MFVPKDCSTVLEHTACAFMPMIHEGHLQEMLDDSSAVNNSTEGKLLWVSNYKLYAWRFLFMKNNYACFGV